MLVTILNIKNLHEEVKIIKEVYNKAWEPLWGIVPLTDEEIDVPVEQSGIKFKLTNIVNPDGQDALPQFRFDADHAGFIAIIAVDNGICTGFVHCQYHLVAEQAPDTMGFQFATKAIPDRFELFPATNDGIVGYHEIRSSASSLEGTNVNRSVNPSKLNTLSTLSLRLQKIN